MYDSNFFEDVSVKFEKNILTISVKEQPIIQDIIIDGVKAKKFKDALSSIEKLFFLVTFSPFISEEKITEF